MRFSAAAVASGTMVTVGPLSGGTDDPFNAGMQGQPKATSGTGQPSGGQTKAQTQ